MSRTVRLTRRIGFSSGHRYWRADLDLAGNKAHFGPWASPYNHGHNYVLDLTVEGPIDPDTGMVVNIKSIDDEMRRLVHAPFDQKSINDEVEAFRERSPSLENLARYCFELPYVIPKGVRIVGLRLQETPELWIELIPDATGRHVMTLTRSYEFAASHRLHAPNLSDAQNVELFGKCNNPAGHGHNYVLEVSVTGEPDPATGFLCDLGELDLVVERAVVERYDHKNLNVDLPEFAGKVTTTETVTMAIWDALVDKTPAPLQRIRLWETARNAFEVSAS